MFRPSRPKKIVHDNFMADMAGAIARAIRSNIKHGLKLILVEYCNNITEDNTSTSPHLSVLIQHTANPELGIFKFKFDDYKTLGELLDAINHEIAIWNVQAKYPALNIFDITPVTYGAILIEDPRASSQCLRVDNIDKYFDKNTFTLDTRKFEAAVNDTMKRHRQNKVDFSNLPAKITSPLILTREMVEHYVINEIIIAPYMPGYGNAVYISGADSTLGEWEKPQRCQYDEKKGCWFYRIHPNMQKSEYKFLTGPDHAPAASLTWENGCNRVIPGLETNSFDPAQPKRSFKM